MVVKQGNNEIAYPIECNPRVHTQCIIYNSDDVRATLGGLLLDNTREKEEEMIELLERDYKTQDKSEVINSYWFYNEVFKIVPRSWLFNYNESDDMERRKKILVQEMPSISKRSVIVALIYFPAAVVTATLLMPVIILLYFLRHGSKNKKEGSESLRDDEH